MKEGELKMSEGQDGDTVALAWDKLMLLIQMTKTTKGEGLMKKLKEITHQEKRKAFLTKELDQYDLPNFTSEEIEAINNDLRKSSITQLPSDQQTPDQQEFFWA
jgi:hypothetical protein